MRTNFKTYLFLYLLAISFTCLAQTSSLVSIDSNGKLSYTADANGNIIPDFSMVGYHQGEKAIPDVPVKVTLNPGSGDRRADIQGAIDAVAAMTPDANGHRGAILLKAGYYEVSDGLEITTSGVVIRGEGKDANGTVVEITATSQAVLFNIHGVRGPYTYSSTNKQVVDTYVPIGAKTMTVESGHTFVIGDRVLFTLTTNAAWITALGMDQMASFCGAGHNNWGPSQISYKRKVANVNGDQITLDAPVVDPMHQDYNTAALVKYHWTNKIEECAVENMRLKSTYASETDESHGWIAIAMAHIENAWVRNVEAYYFGGAGFQANAGAYQVTVEDCGMYEFKSIVTGGRRYGFYTNDCDLVLFKNCQVSEGRHDFAQGSQTPGPNVFTNCSSVNSTADVGPHNGWATGTLWDVISTDGAINAQNRMCSGSGHGWAGSQQLFWNCTAPKIILHNPPSNPVNWAIGCTANITNIGDFNGVVEPLGVVESKNIPIEDIPSLYQAQLRDRLSAVAAAPDSLSAVADTTNKVVNLSWDDNSGDEDGFVIERAENGVWTTLATVAANTTTYVDSVSEAYNYTYRVRSFIANATSMATNEVEVNVGITNLALNKTATQSSTVLGGLPSRAVDGNTSGDWANSSVSHTGSDTEAWWDVDLGTISDITEIKVYNRTDCCSERLSNYHVFVSDVPFTSSTVSGSQGQSGVSDYDEPNQAGSPTTVAVNRTGRYVRVQLEAYEYLALAEVEVFGVTSSTLSNAIEDASKGIWIYPNPTNDTILIRNLPSGMNVEIFSSTGQLIMNKVYEDYLDVSSLKTGMYFLRINEGVRTKIFKFIKK